MLQGDRKPVFKRHGPWKRFHLSSPWCSSRNKGRRQKCEMYKFPRFSDRKKRAGRILKAVIWERQDKNVRLARYFSWDIFWRFLWLSRVDGLILKFSWDVKNISKREGRPKSEEHIEVMVELGLEFRSRIVSERVVLIWSFGASVAGKFCKCIQIGFSY